MKVKSVMLEMNFTQYAKMHVKCFFKIRKSWEESLEELDWW